MSEVKSHIQITKALLNRFSHKTDETYPVKKVYYLDLKDNQIREEKASVLGTERGYYPDEVERFLSEEVESKIGEIMKIAFKFAKRKIDCFSLTVEQQNDILKFFKFCYIRSDSLVKAVNEQSYLAPIFGEYTKSNLIAIGSNENIILPFDSYFANILVNRTNTELVIPRNCFYPVISEGKLNIILPIAPCVAFILINKSEWKRHSKHHITVDKEEDVSFLNKSALYYEKINNNQFVVANGLKELEELKEYNTVNNGDTPCC